MVVDQPRRQGPGDLWSRDDIMWPLGAMRNKVKKHATEYLSRHLRPELEIYYSTCILPSDKFSHIYSKTMSSNENNENRKQISLHITDSHREYRCSVSHDQS